MRLSATVGCVVFRRQRRFVSFILVMPCIVWSGSERDYAELCLPADAWPSGIPQWLSMPLLEIQRVEIVSAQTGMQCHCGPWHCHDSGPPQGAALGTGGCWPKVCLVWIFFSSFVSWMLSCFVSVVVLAMRFFLSFLLCIVCHASVVLLCVRVVCRVPCIGDVPPLCNPPPPHGGDRHLAQKAEETLGAKGAENFFSVGYTGTGVQGDRHLVTAPPPLMGGTGLT